MATINYSAGTTSAFNTASDVLAFPSGYDAAGLTFAQVDGDLRVGHGGGFMTLTGVLYANLSSSNITFANGSLFRKGTSGSSAAAPSPPHPIASAANKPNAIASRLNQEVRQPSTARKANRGRPR